MANEIKIFRDDAAGVVFFEGSTVNPIPTNVLVASEVVDEPNRIKIIRTDKFKRDTVEFRTVFARLNYTRIRDIDGNSFASRADALAYLTPTFAQAAAVDVNASYLGVWDAGTNNPDITALTPANGDWFYVTATGSIDPNGDGVATGSDDFKVDDIVKYCSQSNFIGWQYIPNETVRVDELDSTLDSIVTNSSLTQYDIHVDPTYVGVEESGTAIQPYRTIQQAIAAAPTGSTATEILLNGTFTITASLVISDNKKIHFHGTEQSTIKYASYGQDNGNIFTYAGTDYSGELVVKNVEFYNAGGFAISAVSASKVEIDDCEFENNGWSGNGLSLINAETGSVLGFDSTTGSLQTFYAAECSEGGAIFIGNVASVEVISNNIKENNKGVEIIDSGFVGTTQGFGYITRNQIYNNVSIGLDLESSTGDALAGCRNFTVFNNAVNYNGDTGIKVEGGIDNTISLGILKGNWNSGIELSHVSNTRVRDLDLDNNNRAGVDAEGDESDGLASLQIEGDTIKDGATFIAEMFNVQIHNTNIGSNSVKCGLLIKDSVGDVVGSSALIKIDNVGFIEQDYALDIEPDLDNLRLVIGDCEYVDTRIKAVRYQGSTGRYSELPFSNFTVDTPYVDFVRDLVAKTVSFKEGQGGKVMNVYDMNSIQAVTAGSSDFDIILKDSDKIQLRGLTEDRVFIDGVAQTGNLNDAVNALNAYFTETEGATPDPITDPVVNEDGVAVTVSTGSRTIDPVGDDEYAGNSSGYNHGFVFANQGIDQGGEYYTFQIRREGIIGMGFHKSGSTGIYSFDNLGTGTGNGHYGLHWSTWFHPTPNGPWTYYGEASGQTSLQSGWYNFDDSSTGADWLADENVLMKAGLDDNGHLYLAYYNTTTEDYVNIARKSSAAVEGDIFNLVVKFGDQNVRLYDTPKVHLRAETDSGTGSLGSETIYLFGGATGTLAGGVTVPDATGDKSGFVTSASISASGQYFEFTQLGTRSTWAGLSNEDDFSATFIQTQMNASASVPQDRFYYAGGYIFKDRDSWQPHGLVDASGSSSGFSFNNGPGYMQRQNSHFRVGIGTDGKVTYWQSTDGINYVVAARSSNTVPVDSTLKFLWKADEDNAELTSLTTGQLSVIPTLTYYAIESPDGQWHYPLFQTAEEANYFDDNLAQPTGSGNSHTHVYVDDLSGTTWYMPDSGSAMNSSVHPTGSYLSGSSWNYVTTGDDDLYAPSGFGNVTVTLNEGDSLNQQVIPAGYSDTRTLVNPPSWISLSGYNAVGTAPQVLLDNTTVPSASYDVTVRSSNAYGSTDGTLTVKVLNTTTNVSLDGTIHQGTFLSEADYNNDYGTSIITSVNRDALIVTSGSGENGAVYDLPYALDDGDSYEWPFTAFLNIGIVSESVDKTGSDIIDFTGFNTRFDLLFSNNVNGSTLQFSRPSTSPLEAVGWDDNTLRDFPGGPHATTFNAGNPKDMLKLYNNAGRIELSYDINDGNGYQLFASSSALYGTGSDAPTITAVAPDSFDVDNVTLPSFTYTANGASAPNGFNLVSGAMDNSLEAVSESVASVDSIQINPGQRLVVTQEWAEANVLPYISEVADSSVLFGVSASSADWGEVGSSDFDIATRWSNEGANATRHRLYVTGSSAGTSNVNSDTNGFYDHAIEFTREGNLFVGRMAGSTDSADTLLYTSNTWAEKGIINAWTASRGNEDPITPIMAGDNSRMKLSTVGLNVQRAPLPTRQYDVVEDNFSLPLFKRYNETDVVFGGLTLNAGETYKFWLHDSSIESTDLLSFVSASDSSAITQGITSSGTPGTFGSYLEFNVPSDVQPIKVGWTSGGTLSTGSVSIVGSTYVEGITGITLEGPAANQTGTNVMDQYEHGWISLDEQLSAGERLVLDNAFFADFLAETKGTNNIFAIGLKGNNWANTTEINSNGAGAAVQNSETFRSNTYIVGIWNSGASGLSMWIFADNLASNQLYMNSSSQYATTCAFLEITSDGNNIRAGMGRNNSTGNITQGDESTVAYADWNAYKKETANRTLGISSIDVVMSFWTYGGGPIDGANIDWTGLSEVNVPTAPTIITSWTKALDFSGGSEYVLPANSSATYSPLEMGGSGVTVSAPASSTNTTAASSGRPWAVACVFKIDGHSSNQHIWNSGEGAGSTDDNIYLRLDSSRNLYFGWGRQGALNELFFGSNLSTSQWYGAYIAHNGTRLSGANATAANLADAFEVRLFSSGTNWQIASATDSSTSAMWGLAQSTTGGRMDRAFTGDLTIGGRGGNRNFHGKIASMVVTTLRLNVAMPGTAEIEKMITDPEQWLTDYKVGNLYRQSSTGTNNSNFQVTNSATNNAASYTTQVWIMGDGTNDSYSNGIRNQVNAGDQNFTKLNFNSMVSNDIETVSIPGLS